MTLLERMEGTEVEEALMGYEEAEETLEDRQRLAELYVLTPLAEDPEGFYEGGINGGLGPYAGPDPEEGDFIDVEVDVFTDEEDDNSEEEERRVAEALLV